MRQTRPNPRRISGSSAASFLARIQYERERSSSPCRSATTAACRSADQRGRPQSEGLVVGVERPRGSPFTTVGTAQGEGQLVRRGVGLPGLLEDVDALRDEAVLERGARRSSTDQAGGDLAAAASRRRRARRRQDRSPVFRRSMASTSSPSGDCLNAARAGFASSSERLVVSLLRLRAGEGHPRRCVRPVELEDAAEEGKGQLVLPLQRVDLGQVQLGPEEVRLQPDGFLEQLGALPEAVLLQRGSRPARNRPRLASRGRTARAGPAGRLPGADLAGRGRPRAGGPRAPGRRGRPRRAHTPNRSTASERIRSRGRLLPGDSRASGERTSFSRVPTATRLSLSVVEPQAELDGSWPGCTGC